MKNKSFDDAFTPYQNFRVLRFLFTAKRMNRTAVVRIAGVLLGLGLLGFFVTKIDGSIYFADSRTGYAEDFVNYSFLFAIGISIYLLTVLVEKFFLAFNGGYGQTEPKTSLLLAIEFDDEYLVTYKKDMEKHLDWISCRTPLARRWYLYLYAFIIVVFLAWSVCFPLFTTQMRGNWNFSFSPFYPEFHSQQQYFFGYLFNQFKDFFVYAILLPPVIWMTVVITIATIRIVRKLDRDQKIKIIPLAPDNTGGLKPLGEISLTLFYMVIVQLLHILPTSIVFNWPIAHQLFYFFYIPFAVFVFFSPLVAARRSMKIAKQQEINTIQADFYTLYKDFQEARQTGLDGLKRSEELRKLLEGVHKRYEITSKMAVWPYDFRTFFRFLSGLSLTIVIFLLQQFLSQTSLVKNPGLIFDLFK